jgi:hypothetical protein
VKIESPAAVGSKRLPEMVPERSKDRGAGGTSADAPIPLSALEGARRLGEAEAEVLDLDLKLQESLTRESRLLESMMELQESLEHVRRSELEIRAQLDRYSAFHRDVERSFGWRMLQFLRRLLGRAW